VRPKTGIAAQVERAPDRVHHRASGAKEKSAAADRPGTIHTIDDGRIRQRRIYDRRERSSTVADRGFQTTRQSKP